MRAQNVTSFSHVTVTSWTVFSVNNHTSSTFFVRTLLPLLVSQYFTNPLYEIRGPILGQTTTAVRPTDPLVSNSKHLFTTISL